MTEMFTAEGRALISEIREKWLKICQGQGKTDKKAAEKAMDDAYRAAGLKEPFKVWARNPRDGMFLAGIFKLFSPIVTDYVRNLRKHTLENQVHRYFPSFERQEIHNGLDMPSVGAGSLYSLNADTRGFICHQVTLDADHFWPYEFDKEIDINLGGGGQFDGPWLAAYELIKKSKKQITLEDLEGLKDLAENCSFYWSFRDFVVMVPKPTVIRTQDGVLHADGRPAIEYPGFKVYAYEGVFMPRKYGKVHSSKWDPRWVLRESNESRRQKLYQVLGAEKVLSVLDYEVIDTEIIYGLRYKLLEVDFSPFGRMKFLEMQNPSVPGMMHTEPVAPDWWIKTCQDAMDWRLGQNESSQYCPSQFHFGNDLEFIA